MTLPNFFFTTKTLSSFPGSSVAVIPVFNMPQQDFSLRTEAVFLFGRCHIDPALFTFNDDIELQTLLDAKRLKLVLVDHNILSQAQRHMDVAVMEILGKYCNDGILKKKTYFFCF